MGEEALFLSLRIGSVNVIIIVMAMRQRAGEVVNMAVRFLLYSGDWMESESVRRMG